jgi:hypothetical protein
LFPMGEQFAIVRHWANSSPLSPMGAWDYKYPKAWLGFLSLPRETQRKGPLRGFLFLKAGLPRQLVANFLATSKGVPELPLRGRHLYGGVSRVAKWRRPTGSQRGVPEAKAEGAELQHSKGC